MGRRTSSWRRARTAFTGRGSTRGNRLSAGAAKVISTPVRRASHMLIYYTGSPVGQHEWHGQTGFGLVRTQADRFAMQWADDEPAWLITREFIMEGNRLRLNLYYPKNKHLQHYLKAEIAQHPPLGGHGAGKG